MALHLVKLCVGIDSVACLRARQAARLAGLRAAGESAVLRRLTRHMPRRADEIAGSGSLYWVIKGGIRARQRIVALEAVAGAGGDKRCAILLDPAVVETEYRRARPFQGWRYLDGRNAPPDREGGYATAEMPAGMVAELRELGLLR